MVVSGGQPHAARRSVSYVAGRRDEVIEVSRTTPPFTLVVVTHRSRRRAEEMPAGLPVDLAVALIDDPHDEHGTRQVVASRRASRHVDLTAAGPGRYRSVQPRRPAPGPSDHRRNGGARPTLLS